MDRLRTLNRPPSPPIYRDSIRFHGKSFAGNPGTPRHRERSENRDFSERNSLEEGRGEARRRRRRGGGLAQKLRSALSSVMQSLRQCNLWVVAGIRNDRNHRCTRAAKQLRNRRPRDSFLSAALQSALEIGKNCFALDLLA